MISKCVNEKGCRTRRVGNLLGVQAVQSPEGTVLGKKGRRNAEAKKEENNKRHKGSWCCSEY